MDATDNGLRRRTSGARAGTWLALALICSAAASPAAAQIMPPQVDYSPTAVIELWTTDWRLSADGTVVRDELRRTRLKRPEAVADCSVMRVTFDSDLQALEILAAQATLPDGSVVRPVIEEALPEFARGRPPLAHVRERTLRYSDLPLESLIEFHYRLTTRPGTAGSAPPGDEVAMDSRYRTREREVRVTAPQSISLQFAPGSEVRSLFKHATVENADATRTDIWRAEQIEERRADEWTPLWYDAAGTLRFSAPIAADDWVRDRLRAPEQLAAPSERVTQLARQIVGDAPAGARQMERLTAWIAGQLEPGLVDPSFPPRNMRPAEQLAAAWSDATEPEAAALLLAMARSVGVEARLALITNDILWRDAVPRLSAIAAWVVVTPELAETARIWHPRAGLVRRDHAWAGFTVRFPQSASDDAPIRRIALPAWNAADDSQIRISGEIRLDPSRSWSADLQIHLGGFFAARADEWDLVRQRQQALTYLSRVAPGGEIASFELVRNLDGRFTARVGLRSARLLAASAGGGFVFMLGPDGPYAELLPLPLHQNPRGAPARTIGPFQEHLDLTFHLPEGWRLGRKPAAQTTGAEESIWAARQVCTAPTEQTLSLKRFIHIMVRDLNRREFNAANTALGDFRQEVTRIIVAEPPSGS